LPVKDLKDLAHSIAQTLDYKEEVIPDWFNIEETKDGYFVAVLQKGKWLGELQFRALCALMRDLKGDYIKGAKTFRVPGPLAKKPLPQASKDVEGTPQPASGVAPDSLTYDKSKPPAIPNFKFIPVDAVKIPDFLPTRTLISHERLSEITNSIKKHGLKYPIKVRRANSDYELIDGYLRLKSAQQLGWKGILAEVKDATDQEVVVESLITNRHRIEEDPITVAKKLDILVNTFGYTQEKLGEEIGLDQTTISHTISLLRLPKEIQHYVALHNVSFYHALLLLTLEDPDLQVQLAKEVVDNGLSTRQLEDRIHEVMTPTATPEPIAPSPLETTPQEAAESEAKTEAKELSRAYRESEDSALQREAETQPKIPPAQPFSQATECSDPECHVKTWFGHRLKDGRILCSLCFTRELKEGKVSIDDLLSKGEAAPAEVRHKFKVIISLDPPLIFIDNWPKEPSKDQVLEMLADDIRERKYDLNFHVVIEEVKGQ
jgi:ParB family chromosome partitioning protein